MTQIELQNDANRKKCKKMAYFRCLSDFCSSVYVNGLRHDVYIHTDYNYLKQEIENIIIRRNE